MPYPLQVVPAALVTVAVGAPLAVPLAAGDCVKFPMNVPVP